MHDVLVIPSIDIKDGKTVRVVQGIPEIDTKAYGNDPVETAMLWRTENAKIIHVVDLDCSWTHSHKNYDIISEICDSVIIPVEMGGGVSNIKDAEEIFKLGVYRIIIGSLIFNNEKEFLKILEKFSAQKVVAAMDVVNNEIVISGRKLHSQTSAVNYAKHLAEIGVERIIVTDVKRNGMLSGPNIELTKKIADATGIKITHSGGISNYADLIKVAGAAPSQIDSVIIGRALYENKFPCQKIWRAAESDIFT